MKNLLKEYINLVVQETIAEQLFRKTKPKSMFSNYNSSGGGGGGSEGGYYDYDYTIGSHGDVNIMGVPSYDNSNDGGLDEQDDGDSGDSGGDSDSGDGDI